MADKMLTPIVLLGLSLYASALQFDVQPKRIEIGVSKRFNLNCSYNHRADPAMSSLVSLFISRAKDTNDDFHEILSTDTFSGNVTDIKHDNATISGIINNQGLSFLTMDWKYPDDEVSGVYKCVANGVDGTGHPISVMSISLVTSEIPDTKQLVQVVRNLVMNMDYALDNTCISGCWQRRLDQMMKARFEISPLYNGHIYLLSKVANLASAAVAGESCELYGGYLAEIDDEQELRFAQYFINSTKVDYRYVMIGGSDEDQEHHWVFQRSGKEVTYTKWATGRPVINQALNCLYLFGDVGWSMFDFVCFQATRVDNSRYMCELPQ